MLGGTPHISALLRKARRLGYTTPDDLVRLAVVRGCRHYSTPDYEVKDIHECGKDIFSDAELAVALISGSLNGGAQEIRVAAQLLGAPDLKATEIARLAQMERVVPIIRYISEAGSKEDMENREFWTSLLARLPQSRPIKHGRMPHPDRFMSKPGWSPPSRPARQSVWLRPQKPVHAE